MAVAFGCECEMEGVVTGVAAVAALATEWKETDRFEVSGHTLVLSSAVGAERFKVEATPAPSTDFKFEKQFGCDELKEAGFGLMPFADCLELIINALKGNASMAATMNAKDGVSVDLEIVVCMELFRAEYKLSLERTPLLRIDRLSAQLRTAKKQSAALRIGLLQARASLVEATTDGDAVKQQLAGAKIKFVAAIQEIESLKSQLAEMTKAVSNSGAIIEELIEANTKVHAAAGHRSADQRLAEANAESERRCAELKVAKQRLADARTEIEAIVKQMKGLVSDEIGDRMASVAKIKTPWALGWMFSSKPSATGSEPQLEEALAELKSTLAAAMRETANERNTAEKRLAKAKASVFDRSAIIEELKEVNVKAAADGDAFKQLLADAKKEIESLKSQLAEAKAESKKLSKRKAQAKAKHRSAEYILAEANAESERRGAELKAAMAAASDSGFIIEELCEALAKAKASAVQSAADDSLELLKTADESDTRAKAKMKTGFRFDTATKGGSTQPKEWQVSADGKSATAKSRWAQMLISPPLRSDSQLTIEVLKKGSGWIGVSVVDDYSQWLGYGCVFDSNGNVIVKNSTVANSQAFGDWHSGDRLFVSADLSSGTVSIRTPNGEFTQKWTPSSSPIWFAVFVSNAGTKLRLI